MSAKEPDTERTTPNVPIAQAPSVQSVFVHRDTWSRVEEMARREGKNEGDMLRAVIERQAWLNSYLIEGNVSVRARGRWYRLLLGGIDAQAG
jgi:hypothetical protein